MPEFQCPICLQTVAELVRDHDHTTGIIRGAICRQCNSYLGTLELHPQRYYQRHHPRRKNWIQWRRWVYDNAERIRAHLAANSGIIYSRPKSRPH